MMRNSLNYIYFSTSAVPLNKSMSPSHSKWFNHSKYCHSRYKSQLELLWLNFHSLSDNRQTETFEQSDSFSNDLRQDSDESASVVTCDYLIYESNETF